MKSVKYFFIITIPIIFATMMVAELIFRLWFPVDDPLAAFKVKKTNLYIPSQWSPDTAFHFTSKEGLPGMEEHTTYTSNNLGFRGPDMEVIKPENEFRVFIIGGSTAQCLYLDDKKSIEYILQKNLQNSISGRTVRVYNAGKSGDASPDHLAMLSQRLIHLAPDLVIVFSGFNDLRRSIVKYDYLHFKTETLQTPKNISLLATELQLIRRMYNLFNGKKNTIGKESILLETNYTQRFRHQKTLPVSDSIPITDAGPYFINLLSIAGICSANQTKLVFMTNQSTWNSKVDGRVNDNFWLLTAGGITYKEALMERSLQVFNDTMRSVGKQFNIPVFDVTERVPKSLEYFYDDCHFNINGAAYTGKLLAEMLIELQVTRNWLLAKE